MSNGGKPQATKPTATSPSYRKEWDRGPERAPWWDKCCLQTNLNVYVQRKPGSSLSPAAKITERLHHFHMNIHPQQMPWWTSCLHARRNTCSHSPAHASVFSKDVTNLTRCQALPEPGLSALWEYLAISSASNGSGEWTSQMQILTRGRMNQSLATQQWRL